MNPNRAHRAPPCPKITGTVEIQPCPAPIGGTVVSPPAATSPPKRELKRGTGTHTPTWLADKIDQTRRGAQPRTCPTCNADILTGPSDDPPYWTARVDPTPVDPITEVIALLGGRFSYDLIRGRLYTRADHHHHDPHRPHPVILDHVCTPEVLF